MLRRLGEGGAAAVADDMLPKLLGRDDAGGAPGGGGRVRELVLSSSPEAIAGAIAAMMTRPDSTPLLPAIHCPTLVVVGEEDAITPPPLSEDLQRADREAPSSP